MAFDQSAEELFKTLQINEGSSSSTKSSQGITSNAIQSLRNNSRSYDTQERNTSWGVGAIQDIQQGDQDSEKDDHSFLKLDAIDLIDQIQRKKVNVPDILKKTSTLLKDSRQQQLKSKIKLFKRDHFYQISQFLYNKADQQQYGRPTCICKKQEFFFVGTTSGTIRIMSPDRQFQSLKFKRGDNTIQNHQGHANYAVTAMDIHCTSGYLLAGYGSGLIILWNLQKSKPSQFIKDLFSSKITALKFYSRQHLNSIIADQNGRIFTVEMKKGFTGYSITKRKLVDNMNVPFFCVAPLWPHRNYPSKMDSYVTVALASSQNVSIITIQPVARGIYSKPLRSRKYSSHKEQFKSLPSSQHYYHLPYLSWGRGCTPSDPQNKSPILAYSYGKVIRLAKINLSQSGSRGCQDDGYYIASREVQNLIWLGESVLGIVMDRQEVRALYTGSFCKEQGDIIIGGKRYEQDDEDTMSVSSMSSVQTNKTAKQLLRIRQQQQNNEFNQRMMIDLDISAPPKTQYGERFAQSRMKLFNTGQESATNQLQFLDQWQITTPFKGGQIKKNQIQNQLFNSLNVISTHETIKQLQDSMTPQLLLLGKRSIVIVSLFEWTEFIQLQKQQSGWLPALTMALDIYKGARKGFADVPEISKFRQASLRGVMKDYIRAFIQTCLTGIDYDLSYNKHQSSSSTSSNNQAFGSYTAAKFPDDIIAKVVIEYSISIGEQNYLFSDLFQRFVQNGKEFVMLRAIEPFILAGQLSNLQLSKEFLQIMIRQYSNYDYKYNKSQGLESERLSSIQEQDEQDSQSGNSSRNPSQDLALSGNFAKSQILEYIILKLDLNFSSDILEDIVIKSLEREELIRPLIYVLSNSFLCDPRSYSASSFDGYNQRRYQPKLDLIPEQAKLQKAQHIQNLLNMLFEGIRINQTVKGDEKQLKEYVQQGNNTRLNYSYNNVSFHYQNQIINKTDDKVAMYDGYRLFWIIDKFLNGQVFPYGKLDQLNYMIFVQTITLWLFGGSIVSHQKDRDEKYDPDMKFVKKKYKISRSEKAVDKLERLLKFNSEKMFILLSQFFEQEIQLKIMDMNEEYKKQFGANQLFQIIEYKCQVLGLETQFLCFFIPNILKHNTSSLSSSSSSPNYQDSKKQTKQDTKQRKQLVKIQNTIYFQSLKKLLQSYNSSQMRFLSMEEIQQNAKLMLSEISQSLKKQDLNELSQLTSITPFVELRLMIFDLNQEYIKGLETCLNSDIMKQKLFRWLDQVLQKLKKKQQDQKPGESSKTNFLKQQELNRKILSNLRDLVRLDPEQTVHIIDKWFKQLHQKIIDQLEEAPQLQLKYLQDFLHRKQQHIIEINAQIRGDMKQKSQYQKYLLRFIQLLCIQAPDRVLQYVKKQYFPATMTLQIVVKHKVHDAAALLYKKTGQLELSIQYYLNYLDGLTPGLIGGMIGRKYQYEEIWKKHTFVKCSKEQAEQQMIHCSQQFSVVLSKIGKICLAQKDSDTAPVSCLILFELNLCFQNLWFQALSGIFKMKQKARKILIGDKDEFQQQLDQNISAGRRVTMRSQHSFFNSHLQQPPQIRKKNYSVMSNQQAKAQFQLSQQQFALINGFFQNKIQWLTEKMSTTVKLHTILSNIIQKLSHLPYKEFKLLIQNMIASYFQHQKIMHSAKQLLRRDIGDQTSKFLSQNRKGCVVFGPPAIQIQDARSCKNIKIHNNGASYAIWSSKSVSKGYAEDLVINSKQRVF